MALLTTRGLSKDFGALRAVNKVDLEIEEGSLYSIVGPNGAGKTTLFNLISGFLQPTEGKVEFMGKDITYLPPYQRPHLGMKRSFQIISLFPELTVLENVRLAVQSETRYRFSLFKKASDLIETAEGAYEILDILGLTHRAHDMTKELSHGEQRLLDIGVAMAGKGTLLLLDEPTSGLGYAEVIMMGDRIKQLTPKHTVLLIEHKIDMVLSISDTIMVLDFGCMLTKGPPELIQKNEEVSRAYLGIC